MYGFSPLAGFGGSTALAQPNGIGRLGFRTFDSIRQRDARMIDSTGAFLTSELERLDPELHMPITGVFWQRDMPIREDVTIGDEASSYIRMAFATPGGINPTGVHWIGKTTTAIPGILADADKKVTPLNIWGMELAYTLLELASSQQVGRSIDQTKYDGLKLAYNMDVDQIAYVGDATVGSYGLLNRPDVAGTNVANGAKGSPLWSQKTPQEILADFNAVLTAAWANSANAVVPDKVGIPPIQYGLLQQTNSAAGSVSVLEYLRKNTIASAQNGMDLDVVPMKWAVGRGVGGTDRMVAYTQDKSRIRLPLTPLQNTAVQPRDIHLMTYYYGRIGAVEITNPELVSYSDGL